MSAFARHDRAAQRVHDRVFGATFDHTPRSVGGSVNAPAQPDPGRAAGAVVGIYSNRKTDAALANLGDGTMNRRPSMWARDETIDVSNSLVEIRRHDILTDRETGARWLIEEVDRDDHGRWLCRVNRL